MLRGFVFRNNENTPLEGAYVHNITKNSVVPTLKDGSYSIRADDKDIVSFSYVGLVSDTIMMEPQLLLTGYSIILPDKSNTLRKVTVITSYKLDSLARRQEYAKVYEKQPGITGGNTPQAGVGITLSPVSYFSREAKAKRRLKRNLQIQEKNAYVDYMFSTGWVSRLTGLTGDNLNLFMYMYRPTYEYCRQQGREGLDLYINDKLKEFKKSKFYKPS